MQKTLQIITFTVAIMGICLTSIQIQAAERTAIITHVIDGDTVITTQGEHIRLLDINSPEIGKRGRPDQPFSQQAKTYLQNLLEGKTISIIEGKTAKDRYKRTLAHIYLEDITSNDKIWINKAMIEQGLAHVYSFPDNRKHADLLLKVEAIARKNQQGIWSHKRWQILPAGGDFPDETIGNFYLVQGKVSNAVHIKNRTYLNFGEDWRTDFTVEIPDKYLKFFNATKTNLKTRYHGKTLLVRGILKPVNGVLVTASHPEQLTILE